MFHSRIAQRHVRIPAVLTAFLFAFFFLFPAGAFAEGEEPEESVGQAPTPYEVTYELEHLTADGAEEAFEGQDFTVSLIPDEGYAAPEQVEVYVNGELLEEGAGYTYSTGWADYEDEDFDDEDEDPDDEDEDFDEDEDSEDEDEDFDEEDDSDDEDEDLDEEDDSDDEDEDFDEEDDSDDEEEDFDEEDESGDTADALADDSEDPDDSEAPDDEEEALDDEGEESDEAANTLAEEDEDEDEILDEEADESDDAASTLAEEDEDEDETLDEDEDIDEDEESLDEDEDESEEDDEDIDDEDENAGDEEEDYDVDLSGTLTIDGDVITGPVLIRASADELDYYTSDAALDKGGMVPEGTPAPISAPEEEPSGGTENVKDYSPATGDPSGKDVLLAFAAAALSAAILAGFRKRHITFR